MEEETTSVVVGVIKDLTKRLEDYERNSSADRAAFKATIEGSIVEMRKDFNKALAPLQLDNIDHRRVHENDRKERVDRQAVNDTNFMMLRVLVYIVIGLMVGFIITGVLVLVLR